MLHVGKKGSMVDVLVTTRSEQKTFAPMSHTS
jgi:hypothetical protein